jgi:hypothetical protein
MHSLSSQTVIDIISNCCICLAEEQTLLTEFQLTCCKQFIHPTCMCLLVISGHRMCPLCRTEFQAKDYFDNKSFTACFEEIDVYFQQMYRNDVIEVLNELSFYRCISFRPPPISIRLASSLLLKNMYFMIIGIHMFLIRSANHFDEFCHEQ